MPTLLKTSVLSILFALVLHLFPQTGMAQGTVTTPCLLKASFEVSNAEPWMADTVFFTNTSTGAILEHEWLINGYKYGEAKDFMKYFNSTGTYEVTLRVKAIGNCVAESSQTFTIKRKPSITPLQSPILLKGIADSLDGLIQEKPFLVYDRFGNEFSLDDISIPTNSSQAGIFVLHFYDFDNNTNRGFDDPAPGQFNPTLGEDRREVLIQVFEDISALLSPTGDVSGLPQPHNISGYDASIEIDIRSEIDWSGNNIPADTLARATQFYVDHVTSSVDFNTAISYGEVWKSINTGMDSYDNLSAIGVNTYGNYHGAMAFTFSGISWYTDLTENIPIGTNQYDLYTVALHEVMHILGFNSLLGSFLKNYGGDPFEYPRFCSLYDTYLGTEEAAGMLPDPILSSNTNCYDFQADFYSVPSGCNDLFFHGSGTQNSRQVVNTNNSDNYLSHFNCGCPVGNGYVMNECQNKQETQRFLHEVEVQTLCDLGYNVQQTYGNGDYTNSTYVYSSICTNDKQVAGVNDFRPFSNNNSQPNYEIPYQGSITLTDFGVNGILENDFNAISFSCVELIEGAVGNGDSAIFNVTSNTIQYTAPPYFSGMAIIRYRPVNNKGVKGNITYIYIQVNQVVLPPCIADEAISCGENLVCYGSFEEIRTIHTEEISDFMPHMRSVASEHSPDIHVDNKRWGMYESSAYQQSNFYLFDYPYAQDGKQYIAIGASEGENTYREGFTLPLKSSLDLNSHYEVSFYAVNIWRKEFPEKFSLKILFSENPPCSKLDSNGNYQYWTDCGSFNPSLSFDIIESDEIYDFWKLYSKTFSLSPSSAPINHITVIANYGLSDVNFPFVDNIVLRKITESSWVDAGRDTTICMGDSVVLGATPNAGGMHPPHTLTWTYSPAFNNSNYLSTNDPQNWNPKVAPEKTTIYNVYATDSNGCASSTDEVIVNVLKYDNLLPNGDFEDAGVTNGRNELDKANGWIDATGTPDLFTFMDRGCYPNGMNPPPSIPPCDSLSTNFNCMGVPCNSFGFLYQRRGHLQGGRYAGLWYAVGTELGVGHSELGYAEEMQQELLDELGVEEEMDLRLLVEGMEVKLTQPLDTLQEYVMTFYVSKAPKGNMQTLLVDKEAHFVVKMSTKEEHGGLFLYDPVEATIINRSYTNVVGEWEKIEFLFKPKEAYTHVIIESTYPEDVIDRLDSVNISASPIGVEYSGIEAYMYVDDIEIRQRCNVGVAKLEALAGSDKYLCETDSCGEVRLGASNASAAGGLPPYKYRWSPEELVDDSSSNRPMACVTETTKFILTVTDTLGNQDTDTVTVFVYPRPEVNVMDSIERCDSSECVYLADKEIVNGGSSGYHYDWYKDTVVFSNDSNPRVCQDGTYKVQVTDINGCTSNFDSVVVSQFKNYIFNGDLEAGITPNSRDDLEEATGWIDATGTPDLFDTDYTQCNPTGLPLPPACDPIAVDYTCMGIPCNHFGDLDHRTTDTGRYAGLWFALGVGFENNVKLQGNGVSGVLGSLIGTSLGEQEIDMRLLVEGMEVELTEALDTSKEYIMTFYVSKAPKGNTHELLVDKQAHYVVKMSTEEEHGGLLMYDPVEAPVYHTGFTDNVGGWDEVTFCFKPKKAYTHVIIESTYPADFIQRLTSSGSTNFADTYDSLRSGGSLPLVFGLESYMYVDDIAIVEKCKFGYETLLADAGTAQSSCSNVTGCGGIVIGGMPAATGGVAPYNYQWSPAAGLNNATIANPTACPGSTTMYELTVTDAHGNIAKDQVVVTIYPAPVVEAGPNLDLCPNQCGDLTGSVSGGTSPYNYQWSHGATTPTVTRCHNDGGSYYLEVTDANGCQSNRDWVNVYRSYAGAQLVNNDGFSDGAVPEKRGEIEKATDWSIASGDPELFDSRYCFDPTCAVPNPSPTTNFNDVDIPRNHFGYETHWNQNSSRKRYGGLWAYLYADRTVEPVSTGGLIRKPGILEGIDVGEPANSVLETLNDIITSNDETPEQHARIEMVESMQNRLKYPLDVNKTYTLSFYASMAEDGDFYKVLSNVRDNKGRQVYHMAPHAAFNIKLSTDPVQAATEYGVIDLPIQDSGIVTVKNGWQHFTYTIQPTENFRYLVIESATRDFLTAREAYFYIDDVTLIEGCPNAGASSSSYEAGGSDERENWINPDTPDLLPGKMGVGNPSLAIHMHPNPTTGEVTLQYGNLEVDEAMIEIADATGNTVLVRPLNMETGSMTLDLSHLVSGVYFYRVIARDGTQLKVDRIAVVK